MGMTVTDSGSGNGYREEQVMNQKRKKKALAVAALALAGVLTLGGCGSSGSEAKSSSQNISAGEEAESGNTDSGKKENGKSNASVKELRDLKPMTKDNVKIEYDQYYKDDELNLEITKGLDAVKSVHFLLFLEQSGDKESDGDDFVYLGEDNNMTADYDTGNFTNNFSGYWPTINDTVVTAEIIEETDKYTLYSVPCIIDNEKTSIRALYDFKTEKFRILGRYDGIDKDKKTHMTSRGVRKIKDGAQVIFTLASFQGDNLDEYEYQMQPITWSDSVEMKDTDLGDGTYMFMYEIEDVFGHEIDADPAELEVKGDTMHWITDLS